MLRVPIPLLLHLSPEAPAHRPEALFQVQDHPREPPLQIRADVQGMRPQERGIQVPSQPPKQNQDRQYRSTIGGVVWGSQFGVFGEYTQGD